MSKPVLYYMAFSPPSRFALIVAKHIGLDIEVEEVNLLKGQHHTPEYKAINPTSTVPALVDEDISVFDSTAIAIYLVEKYANGDDLYPNDLKLRTKINERLFYVGNYIFPRTFQIFVGVFFRGESEIPQIIMDEVMRGYTTIETFLADSDYLAGDVITLADLYLWAIMESLGHIILIDEEKFPKFDAWFNRMREHPSAEMNQKCGEDHSAAYLQCAAMNLEKNQSN